MIEAVRFRRSPRALWRTVGAEVLLTLPGRSDFDHLSETGGAIWTLLDGARTIQEVVEAVAERYGVPTATIAADVAGTVEVLRDRGWVERVEAQDA